MQMMKLQRPRPRKGRLEALDLGSTILRPCLACSSQQQVAKYIYMRSGKSAEEAPRSSKKRFRHGTAMNRYFNSYRFIIDSSRFVCAANARCGKGICPGFEDCCACGRVSEKCFCGRSVDVTSEIHKPCFMTLYLY